MRMTNSMLIKDMLWNSNKNLVSMAKKQTEMSTGKRIQRPSDDPVGVTQVLKYKTDIRESEQYKKNIDDGLGWLEISESALSDVKNMLQRVRELTVQAANGTNTESDTQKIKVEVEQLTQEIMVIGNSTQAGRYIFSGLETNKKLFNDDGTFNIDMTSERQELKQTQGYEVSVGEVMTVGVHPMDVFGVVSSNNFFENFLNRGETASVKATQSFLKADIDLAYDYSAPLNDLNIQVGVIDYEVDEALLENTIINPLNKTRVMDAFNAAPDILGGVGKLSDVADVYFDTDDKLVIRARAYGAVSIVDTTSSAGFVPVAAPTIGTPGISSTITGIAAINDTYFPATGVHTLVVQVDDVRKKIDIDFTGLGGVSDLQTEIQNQLDTSFPAGSVSVSVSVSVASGTLDFTITDTGTADGTSHRLFVDYVKSQNSEMISDLQKLIGALDTKDDTIIQTSLSKLDFHLDKVLTAMGEIGGKTNRIEFIKNRVEENTITYTALMSKIQDVDMAEAIMMFKNLENVYRASLSVGSKVIQPSLVDFLR